VLKNLKSARPTDEEVARARFLLKSNFITALEESRLQIAEYLRIQSVRGQLIPPRQFLEILDQVKVCLHTTLSYFVVVKYITHQSVSVFV
jgi:predicted Zn-dependent peptidase